MNEELGKEARAAIRAAAAEQAAPASSTPPPALRASLNWRTLDDTAAHAEWVALRGFVEWFTTRYAIPPSVVPDCWWAHGALVEELSALHAAHTAWFDAQDTGLGPITWHEHLAVALPRLSRAYGGGCNNGHKTTKPRSWTAVTDEQEWDAWTNRSHAN